MNRIVYYAIIILSIPFILIIMLFNIIGWTLQLGIEALRGKL